MVFEPPRKKASLPSDQHPDLRCSSEPIPDTSTEEMVASHGIESSGKQPFRYGVCPPCPNSTPTTRPSSNTDSVAKTHIRTSGFGLLQIGRRNAWAAEKCHPLQTEAKLNWAKALRIRPVIVWCIRATMPPCGSRPPHPRLQTLTELNTLMQHPDILKRRIQRE